MDDVINGFPIGMIKITLLSAKNLQHSDQTTKLYLKIKSNDRWHLEAGKIYFKTKICRNLHQNLWNEEISLIFNQFDLSQNNSIAFKVYNKSFMVDELLGECMINLRTIINNSNQDIYWIVLNSKNNKHQNGLLSFKFEFMRHISDLNYDLELNLPRYVNYKDPIALLAFKLNYINISKNILEYARYAAHIKAYLIFGSLHKEMIHLDTQFLSKIENVNFNDDGTKTLMFANQINVYKLFYDHLCPRLTVRIAFEIYTPETIELPHILGSIIMKYHETAYLSSLKTSANYSLMSPYGYDAQSYCQPIQTDTDSNDDVFEKVGDCGTVNFYIDLQCLKQLH